MRVLTVNAGSSSVKLTLLDAADDLLRREQRAAPGGRFDERELAAVVSSLPRPDAVGHRIVHGGERFSSATRLDADVLAALAELVELAPLHQPPALAAHAVVARALSGVPAVACFDTAFHATLPASASTYAVPRWWRQRWGARRFGFHGLSHAYASRRAAEMTGARRIVVCHLGAGASLAAVLDGRSVDTTMGFTPLEGLVMATRSGSVDPGLLLWLLQRGAVGLTEMANSLEHRSGLIGLAGTADMRELLERDDAEASLALGVYVHRLKAGIAAMAASLGGLEALVFTGGVGQASARVRQAATQGLGFLGVEIDPQRNSEPGGDAEIGVSGAPVRSLVVESREDLEMARQVRGLLAAG